MSEDALDRYRRKLFALAEVLRQLRPNIDEIYAQAYVRGYHVHSGVKQCAKELHQRAARYAAVIVIGIEHPVLLTDEEQAQFDAAFRLLFE